MVYCYCRKKTKEKMSSKCEHGQLKFEDEQAPLLTVGENKRQAWRAGGAFS